MKQWRLFFGISGLEHTEKAAEICGREGGKKKQPFALLAHLRTQGEKRCPLHKGIAMYIEEYYKDWNGPQLGHKAIYENVNHKKYQEALSAESTTTTIKH